MFFRIINLIDRLEIGNLLFITQILASKLTNKHTNRDINGRKNIRSVQRAKGYLAVIDDVGQPCGQS